jgi:rubrerythrin
MENSKAIEILKKAILMEKRGFSFYSNIAEKTDSPDVKKIFEIMAKEEVYHIQFLSEQFSSYMKNKTFIKGDYKVQDEDSIAKMILSKDIKKQINAASFESAAISAAIDFETRAVEVYSKAAEETSDVNEKELYMMLANWERTHYKILFELDKDLKEAIWDDNSFWPY